MPIAISSGAAAPSNVRAPTPFGEDFGRSTAAAARRKSGEKARIGRRRGIDQHTIIVLVRFDMARIFRCIQLIESRLALGSAINVSVT